MALPLHLIREREIMQELGEKKSYISWPVIAMVGFVTIICFDDILYPLQNQGLSVVFTWIFMVFFFVIPYELSVAHLGSVFNGHQEGGLASWTRHSLNSDAPVTGRPGCIGLPACLTSST